mgnify:CR=1 FL=1
MASLRELPRNQRFGSTYEGLKPSTEGTGPSGKLEFWQYL